ncbi:MAG: DNA (cytosine-5-)-methyltransferase [Vicinamibacteria bacterium]
MIYILLSVQTQATGFDRSYDSLRKAYPSWRAVLDAATASLVRILKPSGLAKQKAPRLKAILSKILRDARAIAAARGADPDRIKEPSLSFLNKLSDEDAERYLLSLPGVGPKTARCVLVYSLKRAVFPVDINVYRVFTRLGIVPRLPWKRAHNPYQAVVPPQMRHRLHVNLVHHGRAVCKPVQPNCHECSLVSFCKTGLTRHRSRPKNPRVAVDLFSGAGSLSAGFKAAGWDILFAAEIDRPAAQTYRHNHPGTPVFETDVARLKAAEMLSVIGRRKGQITAVIGGPPCQGYSAAGKRLPHAPTNYLYRPFVTLARNLGAQLVLMENVPGIQLVNGTGFVPRILAHFRRLGYSADSFLLNAAQYGVPQERRRLIFIGLAKRLGRSPTCPPPEFADPQVKRSRLPKAPTVRDVLRGLPRIRAGGGANVLTRPQGELYNHWGMRHSRRVIAKLRRIPRGKGPISYKRLTWRYAGTLIAGHRALPVHPGIPRTITVREAARIQTIPDSYRFLGPQWLQPLQVADAVPFLLARALARHALQMLGAGHQRQLSDAVNSAGSDGWPAARLKALANQVLHAA